MLRYIALMAHLAISSRSSSRVVERPLRPLPSEWTLTDRMAHSLRCCAHCRFLIMCCHIDRSLTRRAVLPCRLVVSRLVARIASNLVASLPPLASSPPRFLLRPRHRAPRHRGALTLISGLAGCARCFFRVFVFPRVFPTKLHTCTTSSLSLCF